MKFNKQITFFSLVFIFVVGLTNYDNILYSYKRSVHKNNLENSSIKSTYKLNKSERKKISLPPNQYQEKMWELSMNPMTGKTEISSLFETQYKLNKSQESLVKSFSVPGESEEMKWVSRGPNNVGGRTKGLMFDPNDENDETVFAGGVSGGLFKNTNIDLYLGVGFGIHIIDEASSETLNLIGGTHYWFSNRLGLSLQLISKVGEFNDTAVTDVGNHHQFSAGLVFNLTP